MQRNTLNLIQGSDAWHQHRASHFNASDAPSMMGASKYRTRSELLREKATGLTADVSEQQQRLYDRGHEAEALIRPTLEQQIGEDLYSTTMCAVIDGLPLSASLDGQNLLGDTLLECKLWNEGLAAQVRAGELEAHYIWQLEHQLLVSGAERVIFATGDGERLETMEYRAVPGRAEQLIAGWHQFAKDLAAYQPEPEAAPAPTGRAPDSLPALSIQVTGAVTASNLAEFKANALAVLGGINRNLKTDEDFANAEKTVKWCAGVEERLAATKQQVLGQTADIDAVFRTMDEVSAETRRIRLELDKLVTREKENRRLQIVTSGRDAYAAHVAELKAETNGVWLPLPEPDFSGAIKGKRTISSMQDAVDTALANSKIAANESAKHIRAALALLTEETAEHKHLFPDYLALIGKPVDDIRALVRGRIAEHRAAEEAKAEQLREKIRQEEAAKLVAAQAAEQAARDEEARKAAEPAVVAPVASVEAVATDAQSHAPVGAGRAPAAQQPATSAQADALIKLGELNARIAPLAISADGLTRLGFEPVGKGGAAKLYTESDLPHIYHAMAKVLEQAAKKGAS